MPDYVLVKLEGLGLYCGMLKEKNGKEVTLESARKILFVGCNSGVNGLAIYGIQRPVYKVQTNIEIHQEDITSENEYLPNQFLIAQSIPKIIGDTEWIIFLSLDIGLNLINTVTTLHRGH